MKPIINGLYLNLQYAEIPPQEIFKLIELSYRPVLKTLLKRNEKFLFGLTGRSIEILVKDAPDVIELLQKLLKAKKIQLLGGTYSNPPLALLPQESQYRQIQSHLDLVKKYFKVKPTGFFPPEYTWDPILSDTLKKFGFKWAIICQHQIDFSKRPNEFAAILKKRPEYSANAWMKVAYRSLLRKILNLPIIYGLYNRELKIKNHEPFKILGVNDEIVGFKSIRTWTGFVIAASGKNIVQTEDKLESLLEYQAENGSGLFFPFFGDIENINYQGNSPLRYQLDDFVKYLDMIEESENFYYEFPDEFLKKSSPQNQFYIKTSSGEPTTSLNIWERDPDSMRIEKVCQEVRELLRHSTSKNKKIAERYLMLAENGDGRGWNPVPERRLECFEAALKALEILS